MMRFVMSLAVGVLLFSLSATPNENSVHNGFWWLNLDTSGRLYFVIGYVEGLTRADEIAQAGVASQDKNCRDATDRNSKLLSFYHISYGQFVDGTNVFYGDYRNKRIKIDYALLYVRDQIEGASQKEMDERLEHMRQATIESGYDER